MRNIMSDFDIDCCIIRSELSKFSHNITASKWMLTFFGHIEKSIFGSLVLALKTPPAEICIKSHFIGASLK